MRNVFLCILTVLFVTPAMAAKKTFCKKSDVAKGQGYEAIVYKKTAEIFNGEKQLATLDLARGKNYVKKYEDGSQEIIFNYSDGVVNGYSLEVNINNGVTTATIGRSGVIGVTPQAVLNDCR